MNLVLSNPFQMKNLPHLKSQIRLHYQKPKAFYNDDFSFTANIITKLISQLNGYQISLHDTETFSIQHKTTMTIPIVLSYWFIRVGFKHTTFKSPGNRECHCSAPLSDPYLPFLQDLIKQLNLKVWRNAFVKNFCCQFK